MDNCIVKTESYDKSKLNLTTFPKSIRLTVVNASVKQERLSKNCFSERRRFSNVEKITGQREESV